MFDTSRTEMLIGPKGVNTLALKNVAVFGIGGVGGHAAEALARAGVGTLSLFDGDIVSPSNINRQAVALQSSIGQAKVAVMAARIADINPACTVHTHKVFFTPDNAKDYTFSSYDYVIDAVDMVSAKLEIITKAITHGTPVISSMGAGNKLHPELFEVSTIEKTSVCPLARIMRKQLKERGIHGVKVVFSKEQPLVPHKCPSTSVANVHTPLYAKANAPGSISFVPAAAGLVLAGAVVRDLLLGEGIGTL